MANDSETTLLASKEPGQEGQAVTSGEFLPRGAMVDRYVILGLLGRGGMGVVYAAYDPELDRRIALKLLRTQRLHPTDLSQGRVRMLREARALAKLSHPNVVALYDAGEYEGDVYLAMEMATGKTLSAWLGEKERSWREVVHVCIQAGHGLAGAHASGLVHRDFKPANVIVGEDGRVRVLDFGLARLMTGDDGGDDLRSTDPLARSVPASSSSASALSPMDHSLTQTGVLVGTPAYMAPEIALGKSADPKSDQFSFCVTLYEALFGERPFQGTTRKDVVGAILRGEIAPAPREKEVPSWVRQIVVRGLSRRPRDRWPTMDALIDALDRDPGRTGRRLSGIAAVFALGVTTAYGLAGMSGDTVDCSVDASQLSGVWDEVTKQRMARAFEASGSNYGRSTWPRVKTLVDDYVTQWAATKEDACEATHIRHEQSEGLMDRRMVCLEGRIGDLKALLGVFRDPDEDVVENAIRAVSELPSMAECSDISRLQLGVAQPASDDQRKAVEDIRERLSQARALQLAGRYKQALGIVRECLEEARALQYQPLVAETQYYLGVMQALLGDQDEAAETLAEAGWLAQSNHDDEILALAQIKLVHVVGYELSRLDDGLRWARHADAAITRLGRPKELESDLLNALGTLHAQREAYEEATASYLRSIELRRQARGEGHISIAKMLGNLALVLSAQGHHNEAIDRAGNAVEIRTQALGPEHPAVGISLINLAYAQMSAGHDEEGREYLVQAVGVLEDALGADHAHLGTAYNSLGSVTLRLGQAENALHYFQKSLRIREESLGPDNPRVGATLANIADILIEQGRLDEAEAHLKRGEAIVMEALGPEHSMSGQVLAIVARLHTVRGEHDQALLVLNQALSALEKGLGRESSELAPVLVALGETLIALDLRTDAREVLERALQLPNGRGADAVRARGQFTLARLLQELGDDPVAARRYAEEAATFYREKKDRFQAELDAVERWLDSIKESKPVVR